jgi:sialic acid synthase SpsE
MRPLPCIGLTPGRFVGHGRPCYLVAEVGQNHNGRMVLARRLINWAADSGCRQVLETASAQRDTCPTKRKHRPE